MDSKVTAATIQATLLNGLSGILAQGILAYRKRSMNNVDFTSIIRFIVYTVLTTPPNYRWQEWLEETFPTTTPTPTKSSSKSSSKLKSSSKEEGKTSGGKLNIANTVAKFVLDQTLSASINTLLFICLMGQMTSQSYTQIWDSITSDFWPMLFAGYRVWPLVCLLNLVVVPFDYRQLVGSLAGLGWGVFLSFKQIK